MKSLYANELVFKIQQINFYKRCKTWKTIQTLKTARDIRYSFLKDNFRKTLMKNLITAHQLKW